MVDSEDVLDKIFLSYNKIILKLKNENITTKNNKEVNQKDLRQAINIMNKKHNKCRWLSNKNISKKYYVLIEGYYWLKLVYFQKEKKQIDADIEFFEKRIELYEKLLKVEKQNMFDKDINYKDLENCLNRKESTIRKLISKIEKEEDIKFYKDNQVFITSKGFQIICKTYCKDIYLKLLENYKMQLTEEYIKAGCPYDNFFGKN